jgi:hypothetical protein
MALRVGSDCTSHSTNIMKTLCVTHFAYISVLDLKGPFAGFEKNINYFRSYRRRVQYVFPPAVFLFAFTFAYAGYNWRVWRTHLAAGYNWPVRIRLLRFPVAIGGYFFTLNMTVKSDSHT